MPVKGYLFSCITTILHIYRSSICQLPWIMVGMYLHSGIPILPVLELYSKLKSVINDAVYDVTRRDTFTNLSDIWAKEIDLYSTNQDCIKMLVGNKVDRVCVLEITLLIFHYIRRH